MDFKKMTGLGKDKGVDGATENTKSMAYPTQSGEEGLNNNSEDSGFYSQEVRNRLDINEFLDDSGVLPEDRIAEMNEIIASSALDQTQDMHLPTEGDVVGKKKRGSFLGNKGTDLNKPTLGSEINMLNNDKSLDARSRASVTDSQSDRTLNAQLRSLPVIGKMSEGSQYKFSAILAVVSAAVAAGGVYTYLDGASEHQEGQKTVLEARATLQKLENRFSAATVGKQSSFGSLKEYSDQTVVLYKQLKENQSKFSSDSQKKFETINQDLGDRYDTVLEMSNRILSMEEILSNSAVRSDQISQRIAALNRKIHTFAVRYERSGATINELKNIYEIEQSLQKLNTSTNILLLSEFIDMELPATLAEEREAISKKLQMILNGNGSTIKALPEDEQLKKQFTGFSADWLELSKTIDSLTESAIDILKARSFGPELLSLSAAIDSDLVKFLDVYSTDAYAEESRGQFLIGLGLLMLILSLLLAVWIYIIAKDNKSTLERSENKKNQDSILRLLNEMSPLQDGDLTTKTTVSDEITGAIADSINATVESLSSLVRQIKDTSLVMRERTKDVNSISMSMLEDNQAQSQSIKNAAVSIKEVAAAIRDISNKTKSSASAASESLEASETGAQQVFKSIQSISSVNTTMDETDKLMGKVQSSSKQISEIVDVLSDITENTSMLALNATVQAAKAGDAGKGFKIVADAIQELANSAADATRRVGALIAAVQTDIQAVGDSLGKAKVEVSVGVSLSESAGESLKRIQEISNKLSSIVTEVSQDAVSHAKNSDEISDNMENLIISTEKTKLSTEETAKSIAEIAGISKELGESVQSFRVEG